MPRTIKKTVYTFAELIEAHKAKKISGQALETARQWLREAATDHDWWEDVYKTWTDALEQIGFINPEIAFSGFWSQGDGASFTCRYVDLEKLIPFMSRKIEPSETIAPTAETGDEEDFRPWIVHKAKGVRTNPKYRHLLNCLNRLEARVERIDSHYSHYNTCRFYLTLNDRGELGKYTPNKGYDWHSKTPRVRKLADSFEEDVEQLRLDISRAIYKDLEEEHEYRTADEQLIEDADANNWTFDENGRREG